MYFWLQKRPAGGFWADKIRRPSVRRVRTRSRRDCGGGLPPPTPSAWATFSQPLSRSAKTAQNSDPFGLNSKILPRPGWVVFVAPFAILPAGVYSKLNGSEVRAWSAELKSDPFGLESLM